MNVREDKVCGSSRFQFKILAPSRGEIPNTLEQSALASRLHSDLMFDLQLLRGEVYREYAGIAATLQPDGRHWHQLDDPSWHVILQNADARILGCARYRPNITNFEQLICSKAAVAVSPVTGPIFRSAFMQEQAKARARGLHYGEASAWAMGADSRCSTAAVNIALMSFALAELLGGGLGLTTASTRHQASSILRRLGGSPFANFEPYYEPMFDCSIELLQFDIASFKDRYKAKLEEMKAELRRTPVVCPIVEAETFEYSKPLSMPSYLSALAQSHPSGRPVHLQY